MKLSSIALLVQLICLVLALNGIGNPYTNAIGILGIIPVIYFSNKERRLNEEN